MGRKLDLQEPRVYAFNQNKVDFTLLGHPSSIWSPFLAFRAVTAVHRFLEYKKMNTPKILYCVVQFRQRSTLYCLLRCALWGWTLGYRLLTMRNTTVQARASVKGMTVIGQVNLIQGKFVEWSLTCTAQAIRNLLCAIKYHPLSKSLLLFSFLCCHCVSLFHVGIKFRFSLPIDQRLY